MVASLLHTLTTRVVQCGIAAVWGLALYSAYKHYGEGEAVLEEEGERLVCTTLEGGQGVV